MRHSVIVPVFNEEKSLPELHAGIVGVLESLEGDFEILFVDDGSTDGTLARLDELAERDDRVGVIRFARNAGKSAAYSAGFDAAQGEIVITMDGDLQDDPAEIPQLVARLTNADLVVGCKQGRFQNEPLKKIPSFLFNLLLGYVFGTRLHDSNSGMRAMRRVVATSLRLHGDLYRFIPQLAAFDGFAVSECPITHRRRKYSHSKYGPRRFWTGLLDVVSVRFLTRYRDRPLHFFGTLGVFPMILGVLIEVYVLAQKAQGDTFQTHVAAILGGATLLITGAQFVATGLVAEMLLLGRRNETLPTVRLGVAATRSEPATKAGDPGCARLSRAEER